MKKQYLLFKINYFKTIAGDSLQISRLFQVVNGNAPYTETICIFFVNLYQFLTGYLTEALRLILGCPTAKWVV